MNALVSGDLDANRKAALERARQRGYLSDPDTPEAPT